MKEVKGASGGTPSPHNADKQGECGRVKGVKYVLLFRAELSGLFANIV